MPAMAAPGEGMEFNVVEAVGDVLHRVASKASGQCESTAKKTGPFDARYSPSMGISEYAQRLQTYLRCSNDCHVLALVYIERILDHSSGFVLTELNVHRVLLAATVVAAKFQDDDIYSNKFYARVGGVAPTELEALEAALLTMLGWSAYVTPEEYDHCLSCLRNHVLSLCSAAPEAPMCSPSYVYYAEDSNVNDASTGFVAEVEVAGETSPVHIRKSATLLHLKPCRASWQHSSRRRDWRHPRTRFDDRRSRLRSHDRKRAALFKVVGAPRSSGKENSAGVCNTL